MHRLGHKKHREHIEAEGPASLGTMLEDVRRFHERARKTQDFPDIFSGTDNKNLRLCWITAMTQLRRELLSGETVKNVTLGRGVEAPCKSQTV